MKKYESKFKKREIEVVTIAENLYLIPKDINKKIGELVTESELKKLIPIFMKKGDETTLRDNAWLDLSDGTSIPLDKKWIK
jgi:hypothetical protein